MKKFKSALLFVFSTSIIYAKNTSNHLKNSAEYLLSSQNNLTVGGYGEVHYHQGMDKDIRYNGKLDVHRIVMLFGYKFSEKTQFITELEFEHVSDLYVEQAFLQHKFNNSFQFRGGLLLIPVGVVNEYHEPTAFNGADRPLIDNVIAPTTWREIGFGLTGSILQASIKYQAYLVNGFNGYNGTGLLNGKSGFRSGRQKGADSYISTPNYTGKIEYYGIRGLNIGLSGYFGDTQSTLYNGLGKSNFSAMAKADSSVVGISMIGIDARYNFSGLELKGQFYHASVSNTAQYNKLTSKSGKPNDLGSALSGFYLEAAYDVLRFVENTKYGLLPFIRYEKFNTHKKVEQISANPAYNKTAVTTGLTFRLAKGAVVKTDLQLVKATTESKFSKVFSAGIGISF